MVVAEAELMCKLADRVPPAEPAAEEPVPVP
jgi:hypothetical protein